MHSYVCPQTYYCKLLTDTLILQVITCCKVTDATATAAAVDKQNSVQHQITASGEKYALPNKPSAKQLGVSICIAKLINQFSNLHSNKKASLKIKLGYVYLSDNSLQA